MTQLDPGFQTATISRLVLKKWNSAITHTVVSGDRWPTGWTLNPQAINLLSGIPDFTTHYHARRLGELVIRLNSRDVSGRTARARWKSLIATGNGRWGPVKTSEDFERGKIHSRG